MAELRSQVTLRPRSKLERVLELLGGDAKLPARPKNGIVAQLALFYLLHGEATPLAAAAAVKQLVAATTPGGGPTAALTLLDRELVATLCPEARVDEVLTQLQAVSRAAQEGLAGTCRDEPDEARRRLSALPLMTPQRIDFLLLAAGVTSTLAPSAPAQRVAARLGYPGASYTAIARSLDAEVPEGDPTDVAWRAHHLLKQHGMTVCVETLPACGGCAARDACAFRGEGEDPALRFSPSGI